MPRLSEAEVCELVKAGMDAYNHGDYACTIKCLLKVIDNDPKQWRAKLYLGMAYLKTGDRLLGIFQLRFLKTNCPDVEISRKAQEAMDTLAPDGSAGAAGQNKTTGQTAFRISGQYGLPVPDATPATRSLADKSGWLSAAEVASRRKRVECLVHTTKGRRFPLGPRTTIGRDQKNTIRVMEDRYMSEFQAVITMEDGEYLLESTVTVNPTRVNGKPVTDRTRLKPGDEIRMGQTTFRVE